MAMVESCHEWCSLTTLNPRLKADALNACLVDSGAVSTLCRRATVVSVGQK
jgi:hypothetical protein